MKAYRRSNRIKNEVKLTSSSQEYEASSSVKN